MSITLRSSVGAFEEVFLLRLPRVETTLIAHGIDPSSVTITKDRSLADPPNWDYTIFLNDEYCRLTQPDDVTLLNYFDACCRVFDDEITASRHDADSEHVAARLLQWIELLAEVGS